METLKALSGREIEIQISASEINDSYRKKIAEKFYC